MRHIENKKHLFIFFLPGMLPLYHIRFEWFGIPTNLLDVFLIGIVIFFWLWWSDQHPKGAPNPFFEKKRAWFFFGIGILLVGLGMSVLVGGVERHELGIVKSWFFLPILVGMFLGAILSKKEWKKMGKGYVLGAFFWSGISMIYAVFLEGWTFDGRLRGVYDSPNELAMYIAPALILLWVWIRSQKRPLVDILRQKGVRIIFGVLVLILLLTKSLGGILSVIGAGIFIEGLLRWKTCSFHLRTLVFLLVMTLGMGVGLMLAQEGFSDPRSSWVSRTMIWQVAWDIGKDHWFFGIGPGNFQEYYLAYQERYSPYLEWAVPQPHNIFLAFWLQTGILGFFGFVFLVGGAVFLGIREFQKQYPERDIVVLSSLALLIVTIVWGLVDTPYWRNDMSVLFWVIFGIMVGIRR